MSMPNVTITFSEKAANAIQNGERGTIFMILKETEVPVVNPVVIYNITDIPANIAEENDEQIKLALMGYQTTPRKVIAYFISGDDYTTALKYAQTTSFQYLVIPTVESDEKVQDVIAWVKAEREENEHKVKAVLPNAEADFEGVINYTTDFVTVGDKTYDTEKYCSRIAGIIAGTPLTISSTYAPLSEADDCSRLTKQEMDAAVDKGEFFVFYDGEKVKTSRAVNSLVTTTEDKNEQFTKIKIVEIMDSIYDDIKVTVEDNYLGKYANSYDNKCLLLSAINSYLTSLVGAGILQSGEVSIDTTAVRTYLQGKGVDTSEMDEQALKEANTGSKVFMTAVLSIIDAIEDIVLPITI